MIKLLELLKHIVRGEDEEGLVPIDNWKASHAMYLEDMGFKNDGIYHYALRNPEMRVKYKKGVGFVLEDFSKSKRRTEQGGLEGTSETLPVKTVFKRFKELEEYFVHYKQKWENAPYL